MRNSLYIKRHKSTNSKGVEKDIHANPNQKKVRIDSLLQQSKENHQNRDRHCIRIKGLFLQEDKASPSVNHSQLNAGWLRFKRTQPGSSPPSDAPKSRWNTG